MSDLGTEVSLQTQRAASLCGTDHHLPRIRTSNEFLHVLWTSKYLKYALEKNPKTGNDYNIPLFYVLYKLHKLPAVRIKALQNDITLDIPTRPIGANFNWITQPFALFIAKFLQPLIKQTPEFTLARSAPLPRVCS